MSNMNHSTDSTAVDLRQRAAELGPGFRGVRRSAPDSERAWLAEELRTHGIEAPSYLLSPTIWVDRSAKLFEAGDYPDKGISVSQEDLVALENGFSLPVPILVEHIVSPIEFGYVTSVRRNGRDLFGTLTLHSEADALLRRSGARSLSVGLGPDLRSIQEVSIVRHPRVESAQLFHETTIALEGYVFDGEERREEERQKAERKLRDFVAEGKLCPAQQEMASALLASEAAIDFGNNRRLVRDLLLAMIERQPPTSLFHETVPANPDNGSHLMLPEEVAFYKRHFPGVSLEEIAHRRLR